MTRLFSTSDPPIILGPMVGASDLAFRELCGKYGVTCSYTEMLYADNIVDSPHYFNTMLRSQTLLGRRGGRVSELSPLVVQLCGNDPAIMAIAAKKCEPFCDAVDVNLGCPQAKASAPVVK